MRVLTKVLVLSSARRFSVSSLDNTFHKFLTRRIALVKSVIGIAACLHMFACAEAWALDGQRQGFLLGLGIGRTLTSYVTHDRHELDGVQSSERRTISLFTSDFRIGYAPSSSWEVYYFSKVQWLSERDTYGIAGVALSRMLRTDAPSLLFCGGLGYSVINGNPLVGADDTRGAGIFVGGGYEFHRHWTVELNLMYSRPGNAVVAMLTVSAMAY